MDTKPQAEKPVLAWDGKQWVRAMWVPKHTKENHDDGDWCDYGEKTDTYYWPEGWYELQTHGGDEMLWHITDGATAWQELPPAPQAVPGKCQHITQALNELATVCFEAGVRTGQGAEESWYSSGRALEIINRITEAPQKADALAREAHGYIKERMTGWDRENLHDAIDSLAAMARPRVDVELLTNREAAEQLASHLFATEIIPLADARVLPKTDGEHHASR